VVVVILVVVVVMVLRRFGWVLFALCVLSLVTLGCDGLENIQYHCDGLDVSATFKHATPCHVLLPLSSPLLVYSGCRSFFFIVSPASVVSLP
jgi:hypothetical protein